MKINEAIEQLKYDMAMCKFNPVTGKDFVSLDCQKTYEADKLAIKSLEAWEKLIDEIKEGYGNETYFNLGIGYALSVIRHHLEELEVNE